VKREAQKPSQKKERRKRPSEIPAWEGKKKRGKRRNLG